MIRRASPASQREHGEIDEPARSFSCPVGPPRPALSRHTDGTISRASLMPRLSATRARSPSCRSATASISIADPGPPGDPDRVRLSRHVESARARPPGTDTALALPRGSRSRARRRARAGRCAEFVALKERRQREVEASADFPQALERRRTTHARGAGSYRQPGRSARRGPLG